MDSPGSLLSLSAATVFQAVPLAFLHWIKTHSFSHSFIQQMFNKNLPCADFNTQV